MSQQAKNTNSMDFLGQKRRVRPVRKIQVSTHFDELDLKIMSSETPEPPGLNETNETENMVMLKDVTVQNLDKDETSVTNSEPKLKSAVYASKASTSPVELNTLVPEDFDFANFNLFDSKKNQHKENIKTDLSFQAVNLQAVSHSIEIKTVTETSIANKSEKQSDVVESANENNPISNTVVREKNDAKSTKTTVKEITQSATSNLIKSSADAMIKNISKDEISESENKVAPEKEQQIDSEETLNSIKKLDSEKNTNTIIRDSLLKVSEARKSLQLATEAPNKSIIDISESEKCAIIPPKRPATPEKKLQVPFTKTAPISSSSSLQEEESKSPSPVIKKPISPCPLIEKSLTPSPLIEKSISPSPSIVKSISSSHSSSYSKSSSRLSAKALSVLSNNSVDNAIKPEATPDVEEVSAPPPLPTNISHLIEIRNSFKPSILPVKPVNGPPSVENEQEKDNVKSTITTEILPVYSSPLSRSRTGVTAEDLEALRKELEQQKLILEQEFNSKSVLEFRFESLLSKSGAQEEALKYKNEKLERIESDYLQVKNDLVSITSEKLKLDVKLAKAEDELAKVSETNAKAYLEKSDEVTALKDKLASFAAIIGQNNKTINSLNRQIEEIKHNNLQTALENVNNHEEIEDELIKMIEEEILRMQDTIEEQRAYNANLQMEVDAEYKFWKQALKEDNDP